MSKVNRVHLECEVLILLGGGVVLGPESDAVIASAGMFEWCLRRCRIRALPIRDRS